MTPIRTATAQVVEPSATGAAGAGSTADDFDGAVVEAFEPLGAGALASGSSSKKKSCSLTCVPYVPAPDQGQTEPLPERGRRTDRARL